MTASSPESPPRRARPHRLRRLLVASGVAVLLVVGAGALAYGFSVDRYQSNLSRVHGAVDGNDDDRPTKAAGVKAQNWLVVGSDSLASRPTSGRDAQKPLWRPGMQRTDTMMLVHLAGDGTTVLVTSIPRDSWVGIPGTVDDTLDNGDLRSLAFRYRGLGAGDIAFLTAPVRGAGVRDGQDVLFLDRHKAAELFRAVRVDRVARYVDGARGGTVPP